MSEETEKLADQRTKWAEDRTLMANERTFSSWMGTGLGAIGVAIGLKAVFGAFEPTWAAKLVASLFLLAAIAIAAYSYMALVPIIQPPIMRALTTEQERAIKMVQLRPVKKVEKIVFPLLVLFTCILLIPDATPLIGALMFGNLINECGAVDRLAGAAKNELVNIVTILLGLSVGSKLGADKFLTAETLGILLLGLVAFAVGTASGVLLA